MSKEFKREDRYLVIKRSDTLHLSKNDQQRLSQIALRVDGARAAAGKRKLNCVVVESDWPEFEPVWKLLEARVCGNSAQQAIAAVKAERERICDLFLTEPISFPVGVNTDADEIDASIKSDRFKLMIAVREGKPFKAVVDGLPVAEGGAA